MQWTRSKAVNVCNFNEKHIYLLQQTTEESLLQSCSWCQVSRISASGAMRLFSLKRYDTGHYQTFKHNIL